MSARDRIVMMAIIAVAAVGAAYLLVVSPERKKAQSLNAQVSTAKASLSSAEETLRGARSAEQQYTKSYAAIVSLGKAVPASQEVPSLIYQLEQASNNKDVEFASIISGSGSGSSGSSTASASSASGSAGATPAAFTPMPFTFIFNGSFFDLEHLFHQLDGFIVSGGKGGLRVSGRLLTIQSVKLAPKAVSAAESGHQANVELTGTITATAYVLPASQGLTGGATPSSPSGSSSSSSSSGSSATAPAVAQATP